MAPYNNAPESGTRNGRPAAGRGAGAGALVGGGLFVGLIALCALVISYNGIFQFAEYGGHEGSLLAHVFPVTYTLLLIMACWVSYLLRGAPPRERLWVDLVLIPVLVLFAATAMLLSNLELVERVHRGVANVIVAVAPLAALMVALLLWMTLRAHMRRRRRGRTARPRPSDDPTTVLRARAVAPPREEAAPRPDPEGGTLKARLLRLGSDDRDGEDANARPSDRDRSGGRPDGPARTAGRKGPDEEETEAFAPVAPPGRDGSGPDEHPEAFAGAEAFGERWERGGDPRPDTSRDRDGAPWDDDDLVAEPLPAAGTDATESDTEHDGDGASVPTLRLPRRSRDGHNPIKRAVEEAPVVPGAAAPAAVGPEPEPARDRVTAVPDHLADEGFDHEPPFGDPASDEADAPPAAAEPEPEAGPVVESGPVARSEPVTGSEDEAAGTVAGPEPTAALRSTPSGPEPEPAPAAEFAPVGAPGAEEPREAEPSTAAADSRAPGHGHGAEAGAPVAATSGRADVPDTAHWEPPEDDSGARALTDYVPPVWTPPEDDTSPFAEEYREPEPAPVLDHDTGPAVRAAFRISDASPEAARPSDEPAGPAPGPEESRDRAGAGEDPLQEPEPLGGPEPSVPDADLPPEAEELPPTAREEDGAEQGRSPSAPSAGSVSAPAPGRSDAERREPLAPVEKRPMVLKPPRPPLTDLASGPPSRRVRSEPLRPDE